MCVYVCECVYSCALVYVGKDSGSFQEYSHIYTEGEKSCPAEIGPFHCPNTHAERERERLEDYSLPCIYEGIGKIIKRREGVKEEAAALDFILSLCVCAHVSVPLRKNERQKVNVRKKMKGIVLIQSFAC